MSSGLERLQVTVNTEDIERKAADDARGSVAAPGEQRDDGNEDNLRPAYEVAVALTCHRFFARYVMPATFRPRIGQFD
jgi:hypothetical protein